MKKPETDDFYLQITREGESRVIDWPLIFKELAAWGNEYDAQFFNLPVEKPINGEDEPPLRVKLKNKDILGSITVLHRRLYELSVNLELNRK